MFSIKKCWWEKNTVCRNILKRKKLRQLRQNKLRLVDKEPGQNLTFDFVTWGIQDWETLKLQENLVNIFCVFLKSQINLFSKLYAKNVSMIQLVILIFNNFSHEFLTSIFERTVFICFVMFSCFIWFPTNRFSQRRPPEQGFMLNNNYSYSSNSYQ